MVDHLQTVCCCMCGDVGFADKLFRCSRCRHRLQHSYCSNYYSESAEPIDVCDWCQSEEKNNNYTARQGRRSSSSSSGISMTTDHRYPDGHDHKVKHHHDHRDQDQGSAAPTSSSSERANSGSNSNNNKNPGGAPSPRTATRRYKLLKDVMC